MDEDGADHEQERRAFSSYQAQGHGHGGSCVRSGIGMSIRMRMI